MTLRRLAIGARLRLSDEAAEVVTDVTDRPA
jgi:hypothetical protein